MEEWFIKCLGSKWQRGGEKVKLIQSHFLKYKSTY